MRAYSAANVVVADGRCSVDIDAQMFKSDVAATLTSVGLDSSTIDEK